MLSASKPKKDLKELNEAQNELAGFYLDAQINNPSSQ